MKPQSLAKPRSPRKPLDPQRFPLRAQSVATASREKVREVVHLVRAPRQTKRPVERTGKGRTGT